MRETKHVTGSHYVGEGGYAPAGQPPFPVRRGCTCISPRIYVGGKILTVCQRCGGEFPCK